MIRIFLENVCIDMSESVLTTYTVLSAPYLQEAMNEFKVKVHYIVPDGGTFVHYPCSLDDFMSYVPPTYSGWQATLDLIGDMIKGE